jgi:biotin synthase
MLSPEQAQRLKEAGLSAYNHNLDTSREFYPEVSGNPDDTVPNQRPR